MDPYTLNQKPSRNPDNTYIVAYWNLKGAPDKATCTHAVLLVFAARQQGAGSSGHVQKDAACLFRIWGLSGLCYRLAWFSVFLELTAASAS